MIVLVLLISLPLLLGAYAYALYPPLLRLLRRGRARRSAPTWTEAELPQITVTLPAYNEEARLAGALDAVLAAGYPRDRLHVVVISDASTDATDDIARRYASQGVELLRMPGRLGKTAAENASRAVVRGPIVVNTDASVRLAPGSLPALIRVFADPTVGVASGHDVSIGAEAALRNAGEASYVGYEMEVRALETEIDGIVGASGCFFAIRRELHAEALPESLSRDFGSALVAREHGFRAVSVPAAQCFVPRTASLQTEYRRKIRTMARGLRTLWYKRHLLNPMRYGFFAFALWSHKVARWLVYPAAVVSLLALAVSALAVPFGAWIFAATVLAMLLGMLAMHRTERGRTTSIERLVAFAWAANLAGVLAWWEFLRGSSLAVWEPTRRPG